MSVHDRVLGPLDAGPPVVPLEEAGDPALNGSASQPKTGTVVTVGDVAPERVRWRWKPYMAAGKLTLVDGDPGDGKSTLALDLAARYSTGSPMPDGSASDGPGDVLLLSAEDGIADTIRPRLDAAGADVRRVHVLAEVVDGGKARPPDLVADLDQLADAIAARRAKVVVIDPLMAFLGAAVDSHRDQDVRRVLHPLSKLAEATGAAFLVIRHLNKSGGGKAVYRGGGSIGIIAAARMAFLVAPDPDDDARRILAPTKLNIAAHPPALAYRLVTDEERDVACVRWEGATDHKAGDLLGADDGHSEAEAFVLAELADGPRPASEILAAASRAGIPRSTLMAAKRRLKVDSAKEGFAAGWTWLPPEESRRVQGLDPRTLPDSSGGEDGREARIRAQTATMKAAARAQLGEREL